MTQEIDNQEEASSSLDISFGTRLRELRQACKLDISRVAAELHLEVRFIEALEKEQHDLLPQPVFVRGYLRSYARLLGVSADDLTRSYNDSINDHPESEADLNAVAGRPGMKSRASRRRRSRGGFPWGITVTVLALAGVAYVYFYGLPQLPFLNGGDTETAAEESTEVTSSVSDEGALLLPPPSVEATQMPEEPVEPNVSDDLVSIPPAPDESEVVEPDEEVEVAEADVSPEVVEESPVALNDAETQEAVDVVDDAAPEEEPIIAQAVEVVEDSLPPEASSERETAGIPLILQMGQRESWVEVRDADRVRRLIGVMQAGSRHEISGRSPFALVIGNADGVSVYFQDEQVDLAPYTKGKVARLSVGD